MRDELSDEFDDLAVVDGGRAQVEGDPVASRWHPVDAASSG